MFPLLDQEQNKRVLILARVLRFKRGGFIQKAKRQDEMDKPLKGRKTKEALQAFWHQCSGLIKQLTQVPWGRFRNFLRMNKQLLPYA